MQAIRNTILSIFPTRGAEMATLGDSSSVIEHDKGASFNKLEWTGSYFLTLDPSIAKCLTGFFKSYEAVPLFYKDCDGIMIFENCDSRYMYLSELKSSFDTERIAEAKTQIISSFLKINMVLTLTQYWKVETTRVKGFIVSPWPKDMSKVAEWKRDWQKSKYQSAIRRQIKQTYNYTVFCGCLLWHWQHHRPMILTPHKSFHLAPSKIGERGVFEFLELYYIPVPAGKSTLSVNAPDYIS